MNKLIHRSGINISGSIRALSPSETVVFPINVSSETTIRNACTRIKNSSGMVFKVNRQSNGSLLVTRIS